MNRTLDADARAALFRRGEDILDADSPAVPLGWISHQLMWRNDVKGLTLDRRAVVEWAELKPSGSIGSRFIQCRTREPNREK